MSAPYLGTLISSPTSTPTRRAFLQSASLAAASILIPWTVSAKERQVHDLRGTVRVNGIKATYDTTIYPGDKVETGSDGFIVFVVGETAILLRSRSELVIDAPKESAAQSLANGVLRLVTGALGATFKRGTPVSLRSSNATIGIRGTGVYMETRGGGTYVCTCWGKTEVGVTDTVQREFVESTRHNPRFLSYKPDGDGNYSQPAPFETHTDAEMDMLEKCVGRRAPWIKQ